MKVIPFSFIHCADLHLDSPFEGIYSVAPKVAEVLKEATFKSFENIIDLAIRKKVDFIIIAGDVFDSADRSLRAQWRFYEILRKAVNAGIQCFIAHGNHDPLSGWEPGLKLPENVYRFGGNDIECVFAKKDDNILSAIYGISYPSRDIKENLAVRYPKHENSPFAIGVLHCNVGGSKAHDNYAPCTIDDLMACNMNYWALGHIHTRYVLKSDKPYIIYSGNTQGRSIREIGEKGCYIVKVDGIGKIKTEFVPTDVVRWFVEEISIDDLDNLDALMGAIMDKKEDIRTQTDGRSAICRFYINGRGNLHKELKGQESDILSSLNNGEEHKKPFVWAESIEIDTRPAIEAENLRQREDFIGEYLKVADDLRLNINQELRNLLINTNERRFIAEQLDNLTDDDMISILEDAEMTGLEWLLEGES